MAYWVVAMKYAAYLSKYAAYLSQQLENGGEADRGRSCRWVAEAPMPGFHRLSG